MKRYPNNVTGSSEFLLLPSGRCDWKLQIWLTQNIVLRQKVQSSDNKFQKIVRSTLISQMKNTEVRETSRYFPTQMFTSDNNACFNSLKLF